MSQMLGIYKCEICGNIVQVLLNGVGELVCCGKNMKLLEVKHDINEVGEKHAVRIKNYNNQRIAYVDSHPMTKDHYIQFIEVIDNDKNEIYLKYFYPNTIPEFDISQLSQNLKLQELCNIHELWGEII